MGIFSKLNPKRKLARNALNKELEILKKFDRYSKHIIWDFEAFYKEDNTDVTDFKIKYFAEGTTQKQNERIEELNPILELAHYNEWLVKEIINSDKFINKDEKRPCELMKNLYK